MLMTTTGFRNSDLNYSSLLLNGPFELICAARDWFGYLNGSFFNCCVGPKSTFATGATEISRTVKYGHHISLRICPLRCFTPNQAV